VDATKCDSRNANASTVTNNNAVPAVSEQRADGGRHRYTCHAAPRVAHQTAGACRIRCYACWQVVSRQGQGGPVSPARPHGAQPAEAMPEPSPGSEPEGRNGSIQNSAPRPTKQTGGCYSQGRTRSTAQNVPSSVIVVPENRHGSSAEDAPFCRQRVTRKQARRPAPTTAGGEQRLPVAAKALHV